MLAQSNPKTKTGNAKSPIKKTDEFDKVALKDTSIQKKDSLAKKRIISKKEAELKKPKKEAEKDTSNLSYAQEYKQAAAKFSWGIKGGVGLGQSGFTNISSVRVLANGLPQLDQNNKLVKDQLANNGGFTLGYSAGLFMQITRGSFFFQPEVLYSVKGGSFDITKTDGTISRVDSKISQVDVPLLFGIRFRQARIFVGPAVSFPFQFDDNLKNAVATYTVKDFSSDLLTRPIVNLHAGLSFEFNHFLVDGRYEIGLSDVVNYQIGTASNPSNLNFKTNAFHFSVGWIF